MAEYICNTHGFYTVPDGSPLTVCPKCVEEMEGVRVPDIVGDVLGWRAWYLTWLAPSGGRHRIAAGDAASFEWPDGWEIRLESQSYGGARANSLWIPGEWNVAQCAGGNPHVAPDESCRCGFYAARTREHLLTMSYHHYKPGERPVAMGQVQMAGKVIPASNGFRAMKVRPRCILVPYEFWQYVKPLDAAYGAHVSVELDNTLVMPRGETPKWCERCGARMPDRSFRCGFCEHDHNVASR